MDERVAGKEQRQCADHRQITPVLAGEDLSRDNAAEGQSDQKPTADRRAGMGLVRASAWRAVQPFQDLQQRRPDGAQLSEMDHREPGEPVVGRFSQAEDDPTPVCIVVRTNT